MSAPSQRNESLDVLRCVAVLLVVGYHLPYYALFDRFYNLTAATLIRLVEDRLDWRRFVFRAQRIPHFGLAVSGIRGHRINRSQTLPDSA